MLVLEIEKKRAIENWTIMFVSTFVQFALVKYSNIYNFIGSGLYDKWAATEYRFEFIHSFKKKKLNE